MNLGESGPQARVPCWRSARFIDWMGPLSPPPHKTVEMNLRRFDRAVSQPEVGLGLPLRTRNHLSNKLSEHGPALNVFWPRLGGVGARQKRKEKTKAAFNKKKRAVAAR
jgi:hypothetical protein